MKIYNRFVGNDFVVRKGESDFFIFNEKGMDDNTFLDQRTNYLCVTFTGNRNNPLSNVQWYKNYLELQRYLVNEGGLDKSPNYHTSLAYSMLQLGFVPVGYCPSFAPEMTVEITRLLEQMHIPYVKTYAASFVHPFYRSTDRDVWVSKMDGSELLGCSPEQVTSVKIFERIISG